MANTDTKWFSFENTNAPQLTNIWGCMIDVLDACLVTGFGSQVISSLVIKDGVGIATFGGLHNLKQFQVIEISGADEAALNGEYKILGLTATTIEFVADLPDQTATGTISCGLASLGWTKKFTGTQKAVYQAKDIASNPYFLRVDNSRDPVYTDAYAKFAKVGVFETCSGIDDVSGIQAPYLSSNPLKNWVGTGSGASASVGWFKWYYATGSSVATGVGVATTEASPPTAGTRGWLLIGNADSFYILPRITQLETSYQLYGFGVVHNKYSEDALVFLSAAIKDNIASNNIVRFGALSNLSELAMIKNNNNEYQGENFGSVKLAFNITHSGSTDYFKKGNGYPTLLSPFYMIDNLNHFVGEFPILLSSLYTHPELMDATPLNESGKALLKTSFTPSRGIQGVVFFDLGEFY